MVMVVCFYWMFVACFNLCKLLAMVCYYSMYASVMLMWGLIKCLWIIISEIIKAITTG